MKRLHWLTFGLRLGVSSGVFFCGLLYIGFRMIRKTGGGGVVSCRKGNRSGGAMRFFVLLSNNNISKYSI